MLKKKEIIIFLSIIVLAVAAAVILSTVNIGANRVVIAVNGETLYNLPLYKNTEIKLEHNTVSIKDGKVRVIWADCKNQICVNTAAADSSGGQIICLPNRVTVEVVKNEN